MAVIYLRHPVHGCKVACVEAEAVYDEKNDWVRYTLDEPPPQEEIVNTLDVKRRRGRPALAEIT
jgi:hypothetical protein|tara:strand:- start:988 stop:1179 length:192 start_codon:yes stop_codon:yes gene_type:complete